MQAADHSIALAYPIDGARIKIEADLSDWPTNLPKYEIREHFLGAQPVDAQDLSGEFRVGYDETANASYVAIEVQDADRGEADVRSGVFAYDSAVVWVVLPAAEQSGALPLGFVINPEVDLPVVATLWGAWHSTWTLTTHLKAAAARDGDRWRREYRIDVGGTTRGKHRLAPRQTLEFNIWLGGIDRFLEGSQDEAIAWVASALPHQRDGRGQVLLVPPNQALGRLVGQVRLWDGQSPGTAKKVRIQSEAAPERGVQAVTDREGKFEVELPVGRYRVDVTQRGWETRGNQVVAVTAVGVARVELTAPPVTGRVVVAEPGRGRPAGHGVRRGAWLTYGVAEGLPRSTVQAILQDRRGNLWLGTAGGGLVRFDGARFTTFTQEDGLASNDVARLVEDRRDSLWMTPAREYPNGLTRLDPEENQIITYNAEDGLALDIIEEVTVDRDRGVWLATQGAPTRWDPVRRQFAQARDAEGSLGLVTDVIHGGPSGRVWAAPLLGTRLYAWQGDQLTAHRLLVPAFLIDCLFEDQRGGLWVEGGSAESKAKDWFLFRYDLATGIWERWEEDRGCAAILAVHEDRQRRVWLGTYQGLKRLEGDRFTDVEATGLGVEAVCAILEDRDGRLWIGVADGGLRCLDPNSTSYTASTNGLPSNGITQLLETDSQLWIGTRQGLSRLRLESPASFDLVSPREIVGLRPDRQGRLWLCDWSSAWALAPDGTEAHTNLIERFGSQTEGPLTDVLPGVHGELWVATASHGLFRIEP